MTWAEVVKLAIDGGVPGVVVLGFCMLLGAHIVRDRRKGDSVAEVGPNAAADLEHMRGQIGNLYDQLRLTDRSIAKLAERVSYLEGRGAGGC